MTKLHRILCFGLIVTLSTLPFVGCAVQEEASLPPPLPEEEEIVEEITESLETTPHVSTPAPVVEVTPKVANYIRVLADGLNVRTGAGTSYSVLANAQKGTLLALVGKTGNWYETEYMGRRAFVSSDSRYTETTTMPLSNEAIERIISVGTKYLGTPYVYGATRFHDGNGNRLKGFTTDKFDCSSLMQYIFFLGDGIKLDVTSRAQSVQGVPVSDLKRGDLLFFTNASRRNNTGVERIGHVGLYLGGNYILHTASDFAKIEYISSARWQNYLFARRVSA